MSDYLPPQIIQDILTRLPVPTILRCTAVCKSWYSLITSSSFISSQLKLTLCNNQHRLLLNFHTADHEWGAIFEHYYIQSSDKIEKLECPVTSWNPSLRISIIGSFNGLYCLYDRADRSKMKRLVLWNPSIRKLFTLPEPRVMCNSFTHVIGFGFLPETNEYKVVKAVRRNGSEGSITPTKSEIYNLSTGNWNDVDAGDCSYIISNASQAFLKDSVHWGTYKRSRVIVSINLKTEKFATLMIPDACHSDYKVSTFKDLLCLIQRPSKHLDNNVWSIWVMSEYGVESSWVKQYRIDTRQLYRTYSFFELLSFRENSDTLLVMGLMSCGENIKTRLLSFVPNSKEVTSLGEWERAESFYVDTYMESLVLIKVPNDATSRVVTESDSQIRDRGEIEEKFSQMNAA